MPTPISSCSSRERSSRGRVSRRVEVCDAMRLTDLEERAVIREFGRQGNGCGVAG
jgi:hypothetical protein